MPGATTTDNLATLILQLDITFPMLEFTELGRKQLYAVVKLLEEHPQVSKDDALRADIEKQFIEKLRYLNEYGGERFRVRLGGDPFATLSFNLTWLVKNGEGWDYFCNGGLQFEGTPQPFGSVQVGNPGWWSINT